MDVSISSLWFERGVSNFEMSHLLEIQITKLKVISTLISVRF